MKKIVVLFSLLVLFSGCATQTYYVNGNKGGSVPNKEELQTFFVAGIGQEKKINAAEVCGGADKVAKVQSKLNFLDVVLGSVTFGIYTPRTAKVYCSE